MAEKLFLIDGHALIFKMYYAFARRPMINSKGADTSILYGFTKYILELLEREAPDRLAVAFDPPGGTFRNQMYAEYKANRAETPQLVIDALDPLRELCAALNIPVLMVPGFEADDVIGTVAKSAARQGLDVYMVTPDKDYGQLIEEHIFQYKPGKAGSDHEIYGVPEICAKYGLDSPAQVIEMLTLCGDTADNVPGVKGVGEIGAAKLLAKYKDVDGIYAHLDELSDRQKAMFEEARPHMALSHELVTIKTDVPVDTPVSAMAVDKAYGPLAADLFEKYEFNSLKRFLAHVAVATPSKGTADISWKEATAQEVAAAARKAGRCALLTEGVGNGISARVGRMTLAAPGAEPLAANGPADAFRSVLEDDAIIKYGEDLKRATNLLAAEGIALAGPLRDIPLMHYLIDPEKSHAAEVLCRSYLDATLDETPEEASVGSLFDAPEEPTQKESDRRKAVLFLLLGEKVRTALEEAGLARLYDEMEEPLLRVLARMEREGVKMDLGSLSAFTDMLRDEIATRERRIREMVEEPELNVSSP